MNTNQHVDNANTRSAAARTPAGAARFIAGCALLGTIGLFVNEAHADPLTLTWFRCAFGLIGLTIWLAMRRQTRLLRLTRSAGPWVLLAGALMVVSWGLFFAALHWLSAGVAIVLFNVQPLWVLALGALWLKEPVGRARIGAASVAMIGLVLATGIVEHAAHGADRHGYWVAVASCIVGGLCMACVTIAATRLRGLPTGILAWWQCALGTVTLWVWPAQHGWPAWGASWAWLAGLGIVHTGIAYTLMYSGIARLTTERVALLQFVYPAVAIVIDRLWLGQRLSGLQLAGIALMSAAIWFAERDGHRVAARERAAKAAANDCVQHAR